MKVLIVTVAGSSTRFSRSIGKECLKCIYYKNKFEDCLLYRTLHRDNSFDKYVIVGGYKFDELKNAIDSHFKDMQKDIVLVNNPQYAAYGSGYSLYLGLKECIKLGADEIVFAEGDLWVDDQSFSNLLNSKKCAVTFNRETIDACKSVVFYFDAQNSVHYIYDTAHNCLNIKEPFLSVYNSGQIWKFTNKARVIEAFNSLDDAAWQGTNLVFIQQYFGKLNKEEFDLVEMKNWLNCNTVADFNKIEEVK